jgi:mobile genetic element
MKFENIFAQVKVFKFFSTTYRNRRKRFGLRINLVAGIINFESRSCFAGGLLYSREVMIEFLKNQLYKIRVSALFDFK